MMSRAQVQDVNVEVLLRCRPFSEDELRNNTPQVLTCNDRRREVVVFAHNIDGKKKIDRVFTFDKVFGPLSQQKVLYDQAIVPIVNEVLEGFNCTIFAYGQTGTGKTYTMQGQSKRPKKGAKGQLDAEAGVIPRAVKQIFGTLESQNAEYSVTVTYLELYNEEITDLLAHEERSKVNTMKEKQKKGLLTLMEDGKGKVLVRGLHEETVTNASEVYTLLERGSAKRQTAETLLNKRSSRSHSLFSIAIHIKEATPEGEELIKCGKLNLVDLAGSENISHSGARDAAAREAGEINKSLLTLGRVQNALVEHLGHIPYRDSKLTWLLRDSLGGKTKTCIIATVSPAVHCLEETLSTLDYAHMAKSIKNKPEVCLMTVPANEKEAVTFKQTPERCQYCTKKDSSIKELKEENAKLKMDVIQLERDKIELREKLVESREKLVEYREELIQRKTMESREELIQRTNTEQSEHQVNTRTYCECSDRGTCLISRCFCRRNGEICMPPCQCKPDKCLNRK